MRNPFNAPDVQDKLSKDPRTADLMKDPEFLKNLEEIKGAPANLAQKLSNPHILTALSVLMGVDLVSPASGEDDPLVQKTESSSKSNPESEPRTKEGNKQPDPEPMVSGNEEEALKEKELGNQAYKGKKFEEALQHYDKAFALNPTNIALLTNKAAVFFEQQLWEKCLEMCDLAVEKGRECRADYKIIAKALARKGNVYFKQSKWEESIKWYDKSLAEHRNQEVVRKKESAAEKLKEEKAKAYIDPEKSLEEKEKGNAAFKKGNFPEAIKHYTEAIRRNPEDAKVFSNRAACYTKLAEFNLGLKDCEECLKLDPKFVKGYLRKGGLHLALKDTVKANDAYQKALDLDPSNSEAKEGLRKCYAQDDPDERRKRAMQNPEVQNILGDPAMQMILQQMQRDPAAIQDHLKNPAVAEKFQKLMDAGIIQMR
jgi:stress-induced-phosphoprotein 1